MTDSIDRYIFRILEQPPLHTFSIGERDLQELDIWIRTSMMLLEQKIIELNEHLEFVVEQQIKGDLDVHVTDDEKIREYVEKLGEVPVPDVRGAKALLFLESLDMAIGKWFIDDDCIGDRPTIKGCGEGRCVCHE